MRVDLLAPGTHLAGLLAPTDDGDGRIPVVRRVRVIRRNGHPIEYHIGWQGGGRGVYLPGANLATVEEALTQTVADLTRRAEAAEYAATHDELTGALNRRGLAGEWRPGAGLLLVDLDRFKAINDTFGHAAGDEVLRVVADRLREHTAAVARLGGDEFAAIPHDGSKPVALLAALAEPITLPTGHTVTVGASIGGAHDCHDLDEALRRADEAMYAAKHGSGGEPRPERRQWRDLPCAANRPAGLAGNARYLPRTSVAAHDQPMTDVEAQQ